MLNVIMLSAVMLNVALLNGIMLSAVMLNVIMLSVIMLSVIMLSAIMLSVIMLSVVMLSVAAPTGLQKLGVLVFQILSSSNSYHLIIRGGCLAPSSQTVGSSLRPPGGQSWPGK